MVGPCPHLVSFYLQLFKINFPLYFIFFWPEIRSENFYCSLQEEGTVFADHQEEKEVTYDIHK